MKNTGTAIIITMMSIIIVLLVCVIGVMSFGSVNDLRVRLVEMLGGSMASPTPPAPPTETAIAVAPTAEPTETPTTEPTAKPTETPTAEPTAEPTTEPTVEPTIEPTVEPTVEPTIEPTVEPTTEPTVEPTTEPTVAAASNTSPTNTGAGLLSFEQFGSWKRGEQPYGTFTQSGDPVKEGSFAGKLNYDFSASAQDDFVIFTQASATSGTPNLVQVWVYGDGSGHLFNLWIQDANGEVWAVPMGTITFTGWQQITGAIDAKSPWPGGRVYGPDNGAIDYPIRFLGLVIDRTTGPKTGVLSFDNITFSTGNMPASTPAPASAAVFTSCPQIEGAFEVICYDIEGTTGDQMLASKVKNNPSGDRFIYTRALFPWKWDGDGQGNCLLDTTTISIEALTPYIAIWRSSAGAPPDLVTQWENYFVTQVERAKLRVKLWRDRYQEIGAAVKGATCMTANDAGDNTYNKIRNEINAQVDAAIPSVDFFGK